MYQPLICPRLQKVVQTKRKVMSALATFCANLANASNVSCHDVYHGNNKVLQLKAFLATQL